MSFWRCDGSRTRSPNNILINRFRSDLRRMSPTELIRKHISTGQPVGLDEEAYFDLRNVVAEEFELHPSAVVLVGSSRMGFGIAPRKRYQEARAHADLDLALISSERFDRYWDDVFGYSQAEPAWKDSREYRRFATMFFAGWIDPRGLPNLPRFERLKAVRRRTLKFWSACPFRIRH